MILACLKERCCKVVRKCMKCITSFLSLRDSENYSSAFLLHQGLFVRLHFKINLTLVILHAGIIAWLYLNSRISFVNNNELSDCSLGFSIK